MVTNDVKTPPNKRGRKCGSTSKETVSKTKHNESTNSSVDPLILHLNIKKEDFNVIKRQSTDESSSLTKADDDYESMFYEYDPVINDPNPYADDNKFSSAPQILINSVNTKSNNENADTNVCAVVTAKQTSENKPIAKTITDMFQMKAAKEPEKNILKNENELIVATTNNKTRDSVVNVLKDLMVNDEWCDQTTYRCYWDCHEFSTTPFGIPVKHKNDKYHVIGCFCSLECAVAHNFHSNDNLSDMWERYNLISMLSREMKYKSVVNAAISRKCLKAFGGNLTIEEFREKSSQHTIMNVLNYPMVSLVEQVEEINDFFCKQQHDFIPLDKTRIEKIEEANKGKMLTHVKSALETTMNLRMETT